MKTLYQMLLSLIFGVLVSAGETPRVNELQKQYGGPFLDLPQESRDRTIKYFKTFRGAFMSLGREGFGDVDNLQTFYKTSLLPLIQPLNSGNPTEKKAFKAAQAVFEAIEYAAANSKAGNAAWNNKEKNALLRVNTQPVTVESLAAGIGELLLDFRQSIDPSGFDEFRRAAESSGQKAGASNPAVRDEKR